MNLTDEDGNLWRVESTGKCKACKGTGIRMGLQWGSAEWPGCDDCAPHLLVTGTDTGKPEQRIHPLVGHRLRLVPVLTEVEP